MGQEPRIDLKEISLNDWLRVCGTQTGTFTFNDVIYTDLNEVAWRLANNDWLTARGFQ